MGQLTRWSAAQNAPQRRWYSSCTPPPPCRTMSAGASRGRAPRMSSASSSRRRSGSSCTGEDGLGTAADAGACPAAAGLATEGAWPARSASKCSRAMVSHWSYAALTPSLLFDWMRDAIPHGFLVKFTWHTRVSNGNYRVRWQQQQGNRQPWWQSGWCSPLAQG